MTGLACVESGGRYTARNPVSGSYGKYQIMPKIWRAWAGRYLGNPWADPTPRAQEYVARRRIADLYALHQRWSLVAHWWLTGNADSNRALWSSGATSYVDAVMAVTRVVRSRAGAERVPAACYPRALRPPRIRTQPIPRVVVTGGRAFIRVAPGYKNRAVGTVRRGQVLAVLDSARDSLGKKWLYVGLRDGRKAWVVAWLTSPRR